MTNLGKINQPFDMVGDYTVNAKKIVFHSGSSLKYVGFAAPGLAVSSLGWQISKVTYSGADVIAVDFGSGSNGFLHRWNDFERISYS